MVFSCFAVYVLVYNTRVVPYFQSCMAALFASTYTAKQLKTMYYSLNKTSIQLGSRTAMSNTGMKRIQNDYQHGVSLSGRVREMGVYGKWHFRELHNHIFGRYFDIESFF